MCNAGQGTYQHCNLRHHTDIQNVSRIRFPSFYFVFFEVFERKLWNIHTKYKKHSKGGFAFLPCTCVNVMFTHKNEHVQSENRELNIFFKNYTLKKHGSLHAVMVLFRTTFWRTLLCRNGSLLEFRVLCSRPFDFQICNCQSTSLLIFWSSVIQLYRLLTHSQQVNDFILKFKYKCNFKIVTGFQTNMFLSFFLVWSHIA